MPMRNRLFVTACLGGVLWAASLGAQQKAALSTQDYIDIQQLYARYNEAIDGGNAEAYADTFTPDGTFNTFKGRQGLIDFIGQWTGRMNGGNRRHWNTNLVITPTPDGASGSVYLMLLDVSVRPPVIATTAKYTDTLVKTPQGWRFKTRATRADPPPPAQPKP
jgi:ketosteroid isomerase-like protein